MTSKSGGVLPVILVLGLLGCTSATRIPEPYRVAGPDGSAEVLGEEEDASPEAAAVEAPEEEEERENHIALFLGSSRSREGEYGFTAGLDLAHHFTGDIAIVAFCEFVAGEFRSAAFGAGVEWRPVGDLWLVLAPGLEYEDGEFDSFLRVGGLYEFPIGDRYFLAPTFYWDLYSTENVVVFGLTLGMEF